MISSTFTLYEEGLSHFLLLIQLHCYCRKVAQEASLLFMENRHHDFDDTHVIGSSEQRLEYSSSTCQVLVEGFMKLFAREEKAGQRGYEMIQKEALER